MSGLRESRFGRFRVTGELGRGAMGVVYSARAADTQQEVAIKVLSAGRRANPAQRTRFRREVDALARLSHPGLIQVLDAGESGGVPWFAMRRIQGESLEERLRRGPLSVEQVIDLGRQLCSALGAVHAAGLLHRDIKPDNILIGPDDHYVLTDFGLTKDLEVAESIELSRAGAALGTPGFWSPEQAGGQTGEIGPASDLYSLGATLYAALTTRPPIEAESFVSMLVATQQQTPRTPAQLGARTPRWLDQVLLRCLAKDPAERFASAAELDEALARQEPLETPARMPALGLGLLGCGLMVALGLAASWKPAPAEVVASQAGPSASVDLWLPPPQAQGALAELARRRAELTTLLSEADALSWRARLCEEALLGELEQGVALQARLSALAELAPRERFPATQPVERDFAARVLGRVSELERAADAPLPTHALLLLEALAAARLQAPLRALYGYLGLVHDQRLVVAKPRPGLRHDYTRAYCALVQLGLGSAPQSYGRQLEGGAIADELWRDLTLFIGRREATHVVALARDPRLPPRLQANLLRWRGTVTLQADLDSSGGWSTLLEACLLASGDPSVFEFSTRLALKRLRRGLVDREEGLAEVARHNRLLGEALAPLNAPEAGMVEDSAVAHVLFGQILRKLRGEELTLEAELERFVFTRGQPMLASRLRSQVERWTLKDSARRR